MNDCIFCKISKGEIPSYTIYEDDELLAFLDIHPASKGHTLLVSKSHYDHVESLPDELYVKMMTTSRDLIKVIQENLEVEHVGMTVIGLDVPHAHLHLIPLYEGGEIKLSQDLDGEPDHTSLSVIANKLKLDGIEDS